MRHAGEPLSRAHRQSTRQTPNSASPNPANNNGVIANSTIIRAPKSKTAAIVLSVAFFVNSAEGFTAAPAAISGTRSTSPGCGAAMPSVGSRVATSCVIVSNQGVLGAADAADGQDLLRHFFGRRLSGLKT